MAKAKSSKSKKESQAVPVPLDTLDAQAIVTSWMDAPRVAPPQGSNLRLKSNPMGITHKPHTRAALAKRGVNAIVVVFKRVEMDESKFQWPEKAGTDEYGVYCATHGTWHRVLPVVEGRTVSVRKAAVQHLPLTSGFDGRGGSKPKMWPLKTSNTDSCWCPGCVSGLASDAAAES